MDDLIEHVSEGVLVADADWRVTGTNGVAMEVLDRDRSKLIGIDVREVFPRSVSSTFHEHFEGPDPITADITFEEYFPSLQTWLAVETVEVDAGLAIYLVDVTERKRLERALDDREAELGRLNRINAIIEGSIRELVGATTREEIERTVCERLAATELYEFCWIGERELSSERIAHRVAAGEHEGVLDSVLASQPDTDASEGIEFATMRTGETRIVREIAGNERVPEAVRREAFARGLQSAIAVPLQYGTTTYGVLGVYATRPDAFSERERESLETLGVATGFVINAARQRNLLLSDTVVEVTLEVTDPEVFFVAASAKLDCELVIEGVVPLEEGTILCYVAIEESDPDDLLEMATDHSAVRDGRIVSETSTEIGCGGLVELAISGASPLLQLTELGATIRSAEFDSGVGRILGEIAPSEDVREIVEAVGEGFPETQLLAKQELTRSAETAQEFRSAVHERLTERQRTMLRTAHLGGYFKTPRDSTAEQLAETVGVSSPTLHHHLRTAQAKLVDAFFDDDHADERIEPKESRNTGGE